MSPAQIAILVIKVVLTDFIVFNFCFLPLIYFFYPETRNLTLEQIDRLFTNEKVQLYWDSSMGIAGDVDTRVGNATAKDLESVNAQHVEWILLDACSVQVISAVDSGL